MILLLLALELLFFLSLFSILLFGFLFDDLYPYYLALYLLLAAGADSAVALSLFFNLFPILFLPYPLLSFTSLLLPSLLFAFCLAPPYLEVSYLYGFYSIVHYECGFDPYSDARLKFDIFYYLIALLFLIFDFEILFLYPYSYLRYESFIVYFEPEAFRYSTNISSLYYYYRIVGLSYQNLLFGHTSYCQYNNWPYLNQSS
jgi:NADH:ubiquinone oxidoreductase subunit 3 (subunit A)